MNKDGLNEVINSPDTPIQNAQPADISPQKSNKKLFIVGGIVLLLLTALGSFLLGTRQSKPIVLQPQPTNTSSYPTQGVATNPNLVVASVTPTNPTAQTYTSNVFPYSLTLPPGWTYLETHDSSDIPTVRLRKTSSVKAAFSNHLLPEIYIGGGSVYSTSGGVCFNQTCSESGSFSVTINSKVYTTPIIQAAVSKQFDYFAFQFTLKDGGITWDHYPNTLYPEVTASFATEAEKAEIIKIISSLVLFHRSE